MWKAALHCSANPARIARIEEVGMLTPGRRADFCCVQRGEGRNWSLAGVWVAGADARGNRGGGQ